MRYLCTHAVTSTVISSADIYRIPQSGLLSIISSKVKRYPKLGYLSRTNKYTVGTYVNYTELMTQDIFIDL
jgi:hypothetical protein